METANKQAFWVIEKVLFESAFIHSHLLPFFDFNMDTGDYEIKDGCTGYEDIDKAFELINTAWTMWIRAKQNAMPKGFVLVNKECSDEMAEVIATTANVCGGIANDIYDAVIKQAVVEATEGK